MKNKNLIIKIKKLADFHVELLRKGGPSFESDLFDNVWELQEQILNHFGLPELPNFIELITFRKISSDFEIEKIIEKLHFSANEYLLSNVKSELQTLKEAQEFKLDAFFVLPELKIKIHTYTLFIYNNILLKYKDTPENILKELKLVNKQSDIYSLLIQRVKGDVLENPNYIALLEK